MEADTLWTTACGKKRWRGDRAVEDDIRNLPDEQIWQMRSTERKTLIDRLRKRYARQLASEGGDPSDANHIFDGNSLTLGFARRFATYKRPDLLLLDSERLVRLLSDPQRPVQLILAGKAHPQNLPGQALIKKWKDFIRRPEVRSRVVFLSDYDMMLAQHMVHGIDLWINTPRRPWEACGTSGMKVLVNGGLNLSELDKKLLLFGDKQRLKQVMTNLIMNAIKYTETGNIDVGIIEDVKTARIFVLDTGIGISDADKGRIFERFYRVDKDRSRSMGVRDSV